MIKLEGSHKVPLKGAVLSGVADANEKVYITLNLRRGKRYQPGVIPDQKHWADHSPLKHVPLTHAELGSRVGADAEDIAAVIDYLKSKELVVLEADAVGRHIRAVGTVKQMEEVFGVTLHYYRSDRGMYRGREGDIYLPEAIAGIVKGVFGLDNRPVARRGRVRRGAGAAAGAAAADGGAGRAGAAAGGGTVAGGASAGAAAASAAALPAGTSVLTPPGVAGLYQFPQGVDVSGQTIGILEFGGGYNADDVMSYCKGLGVKNPVLKSVAIAPAANTPEGNVNDVKFGDTDFEVLLDIEVIAAVAPGVNIVVYFAPNTDDGWINAFKAAVFDTVNNPTVFSISWGGTETDWSPQSITALHDVFQEASSMGKTILFSSGDNGTDDQKGEKKAFVEYPAADPYVTACGGTVISNVKGGGFSEQVWNDAGASGGGVSTVFTAVPDWQKAAGVPPSVNPGGGTGRGVPDIAGNASPYSGYYLFLYGKSTSELLITSGQGAGHPYGSEGGTSAVAPLYAGLVALLNAALGRPVGYLNPTLYPLMGTDAFRAVTVGTNAFNGAPGYTAGPGWNACTGLGSVNGKTLLERMKGMVG